VAGPVLLTLCHTGLRVGELCNLRLADVTISEPKGSLAVRSGKGDKDRTVLLNHDVLFWLQMHPRA